MTDFWYLKDQRQSSWPSAWICHYLTPASIQTSGKTNQYTSADLVLDSIKSIDNFLITKESNITDILNLDTTKFSEINRIFPRYSKSLKEKNQKSKI